jgi:hypothetical protein
MDYKAVGEAIRKRRALLDYNQTQAAELSNLSVNHYAAIERGESHASLGSYFQIVEGLGISIDSLLAGEYEPSGDAFVSAILMEIKQLPPTHRKLIYEYIQGLKKFPNLKEQDNNGY